MEKENKQLLTEGPIIKTLLRLALPIMASSFLLTAYNIMDMAWVGTLGAKAVAGVGVGGMYTWFASGISNLPKMGGQVLTAQHIGQHKLKDAKHFARAAVQITLVFALLYAFICLVFTEPLVDFFNLQDTISRNAALLYTRVVCGLIVFSFLNVTLTGISTAQGDSKTPLIANFIGLILNMILDPVLILGLAFFPRLEALGAAVATVSSQGVVLVVLMIRTFISKNEDNVLKHQTYYKPVSFDYYKKIFVIGTPSSLQSTLYCFISMILTRFVSSFGPEALAVQRVGGQIEAVTWNTAEGFGSALNAFCGQNYGAKKPDRIRKGYRFSLLVTAIWGTLMMLAFVLFPRSISSVFFHEELAITISISYLFVIGFCEPFMAVELMTIGALSGLGKTLLSSIISIIVTGLRIPIAYVLMHTSMGLDGIWWALTVTSMAKGIIFVFVFQWISKTQLHE